MNCTRTIARTLSLTCVCALLSIGTSHGAVSPAWKASPGGTVQWQAITSLGNVVVSTSNALVGIDAESGSVAWTNASLAGLSRSGYQEIPQSPFVLATRSDKSVVVLEPFEGKVLFDSKKAGVTSIAGKFPLYQGGGLLLASPEGGKYTLTMVNLSSGAKACRRRRWTRSWRSTS
jgi:outer membrane protein assembly factor BamB